MENIKTQVEKDIEFAELSFRQLSTYSPNLEMYLYIKENITVPLLKKIKLSSELSFFSAELVFTIQFLTIPFDICTIAHLYIYKPVKVVEYIKRTIIKYDVDLGNIFIDLIVRIINDPKRFQKQGVQLDFLKKELANLRAEDIHRMEVEALNVSSFEFFTGIVGCTDVKSLVASFCEVRGWLMTEKEIVSDFFAKNEIEILNQIDMKYGHKFSQGNFDYEMDLKTLNHPKKDIDNLKEVISVPIFCDYIIDKVVQVLDVYFSKQEKNELRKVIKSGECANEKLLFKGNGNQLANMFRQLYDNNFIVGCDKKCLEKWIANNFVYMYRGVEVSFTPDYIEKCISRNYYPCKNPLIEIKNKEIVIVKKHSKRKQSKY